MLNSVRYAYANKNHINFFFIEGESKSKGKIKKKKPSDMFRCKRHFHGSHYLSLLKLTFVKID